MILAFDVCYNGNNIAQSVCVGFEQWSDQIPKVVYKDFVIGLEEYAPGEFYKRELPCIEKLLHKMDLKKISTIIVDGYVYLDDAGKPGLGAHLYHRCERLIPVIGVAKTPFANNTNLVKLVYRGKSSKPLYVSSIGVDPEEAARSIQHMHGEFRIPSILKKLDTLTRQ
jgi:deoxyribonuclease V